MQLDNLYRLNDNNNLDHWNLTNKDLAQRLQIRAHKPPS